MPVAPPQHRHSGWKPWEVRKAELDKKRGNPASRGYDKDWQKLRAEVLAESPYCREAGCTNRAIEVHHIIPISRRPELRLDRANLLPLCKPHHSARTRREQTTSWSRREEDF